MSEFLNYLTEEGAVLENGRVTSFKDDAKAYNALQNNAIVVPLGTAALRVTGADRLEFVHGQVSNEVKRLSVGEFSDSLMLNHKGHALAQMRVVRRKDDLLVFIEGSASVFVKQQLEAHIIFDQVELEPLNWVSLSVQGADAASILEQSLGSGLPTGKEFLTSTFEGAEVLISASTRSVQGGFDLATSADAGAGLTRTLLDGGATLVGEEALNLARVSAGIPHAEYEGGEGSLPQEAGLEPLISYTKGCYLGQEIMARIEARGNLRRSLHGLKLENMPDPEARDIELDGKRVGRLGTVVEHPDLGVIALAILRNDIDPKATLFIGETEGRLEPLPFKAVSKTEG